MNRAAQETGATVGYQSREGGQTRRWTTGGNREDQAMYEFTAELVSVEEDDYCVVVGLADSSTDPSRYVILQNAKAYDDQDRELGMDHAHLEVGGGLEPCYGGLERVSLLGMELELLLSDVAQRRLGIKGGIAVTLKTLDSRGPLEAALGQICASEKIAFVLSATGEG